MKGLLLKDFYNLRKQILWYSSMLLIFFVVSLATKNIAFISMMMIMITISIPLSALAYEEKESWQKFVITSGLDCKIIVLEKYLLGIIFMTIGIVLYLLVFLLKREEGLTWFNFPLPISMAIIAESVALPLIFYFGVEKARVMTIGILFMIVALGIGALFFFDKITNSLNLLLMIVSIFLAMFFLIVSIFSSVRIYRNKDF